MKAIFAQSQMGTYGTLSVNHSFQNAILEDQVALTVRVDGGQGAWPAGNKACFVFSCR